MNIVSVTGLAGTYIGLVIAECGAEMGDKHLLVVGISIILLFTTVIIVGGMV